MLRSFPIAYRIGLVVIVLSLTFFLACLGFYSAIMHAEEFSLQEIHVKMLTGHKEKIRTATHAMAVTLGEAVTSVPEDKKLDLLKQLTANIRFEEDGSGYFFVYDHTVAVSVPAKRSAEGNDLSEVKDKNGVYYVRDLAKNAAQGGGFVEYIFAKPDQGDQPKLAYSEMIPGTKYWIGTGVYIDNIDQEQVRVSKELDAAISKRITEVAVAVGVVLLAVILGSMGVIRSIVVPIHQATSAAQAIARGDLEVRLDERGRDEAADLQRTLQEMIAKLRDNLAEIKDRTREAEAKALAAEAATETARQAGVRAEQAKSEGMHHAAVKLERIVGHLAHASEELAAKAQAIRDGSLNQQSRIENTATAMEEMNATVLEVARNASFAASSSQSASQKAREGAEVVNLSIQAMAKTQHQTESLRTNMGKLGEQAQSIGKIMAVITDIADQTNLLALNAAIEAARAGDAGRGFAVVADEVRKLAEKTMTATKEVGDAITGIQKATVENIKSVEIAATDLATAVTHSAQSGDVLQEIVNGAEISADQIREIATAAEEQSASSEEITSAVDSISSIAVATAQEIGQAAVALQEMASQTEALRILIEDLKSQSAH